VNRLAVGPAARAAGRRAMAEFGRSPRQHSAQRVREPTRLQPLPHRFSSEVLATSPSKGRGQQGQLLSPSRQQLEPLGT
jgi:hypothetical protein